MEYANTNIGDAGFKAANLIWTDDIKLDNTIVFRHVVKSSPDGKKRIDY